MATYEKDDFVLYMSEGDPVDVRLGRFVEYIGDKRLMARVMTDEGVMLPYLVPVPWLKGKLIAGSRTNKLGVRLRVDHEVLVRCLPIDFYRSGVSRGEVPYVPKGVIVGQDGQRFRVRLKDEERDIECRAFQLERSSNQGGHRKEERDRPYAICQFSEVGFCS